MKHVAQTIRLRSVIDAGASGKRHATSRNGTQMCRTAVAPRTHLRRSVTQAAHTLSKASLRLLPARSPVRE